MILFHTDLDNTLIYSYKHDIGSAKQCVELYKEREISFITDATYALLKEIKEHVTIVPTTTRTVGQYNRIDLGVGAFRYALACNGGVLLADGKEDMDWYAGSLAMVSESKDTLAYGEELLKKDPNRCMEIRNIQGLFTFTKSEKPLDSVNMLKQAVNTDQVDIFHNGIKVYIVPKKLTKGAALLRLKKRLKSETIIAAGDSEFDISMINSADFGLAPLTLKGKKGIGKDVKFMQGKKVFSEELLNYIKGNILKTGNFYL